MYTLYSSSSAVAEAQSTESPRRYEIASRRRREAAGRDLSLALHDAALHLDVLFDKRSFK